MTAIVLPPHVSPPWGARPFLAEERAIVVGAVPAEIRRGADACADAEGLRVLDAGADWAPVVRYATPPGAVAVLRRWAWDCDDGGLVVEDSLPLVQLRLMLGEQAAPGFPADTRGLVGRTGDDAHEGWFALPEGRAVEIQARCRDSRMWHIVAGVLRGYVVDAECQRGSIEEVLGRRGGST